MTESQSQKKNRQHRKPARSRNRGRGLRARGRTLPGTHVPIMVDEILATLKPQRGETIMDCTLGYGGHTQAFAPHIGSVGRIIGLDVDQDELEKTRVRLTKISTRLSVHHESYANLSSVLQQEGLPGVDILFADLGVSSMQVDDPLRGISYKHKAPLDMRMDRQRPETGIDLLARLSAEELSTALRDLSDEPDHEAIADTIVQQRESLCITQTSQLIRLIFQAKGITIKQWKEQQQKKFNTLHPAARTFQTLRILVNDEIGALEQLLQNASQCLKPGGRIGIISFHSGEDRLVKQAFRQGKAEGLFEYVSPQPLIPRRLEIMQNPRCSGAKFRYARKPLATEVVCDTQD